MADLIDSKTGQKIEPGEATPKPPAPKLTPKEKAMAAHDATMCAVGCICNATKALVDAGVPAAQAAPMALSIWQQTCAQEC